MDVYSSHLPRSTLDASILVSVQRELCSVCSTSIVFVFGVVVLSIPCCGKMLNYTLLIMCDHRQPDLFLWHYPELGLVIISPSQADCGGIFICMRCSQQCPAWSVHPLHGRCCHPAGAMNGIPQIANTFFLCYCSSGNLDFISNIDNFSQK